VVGGWILAAGWLWIVVLTIDSMSESVLRTDCLVDEIEVAPKAGSSLTRP
jgi:hypothetical protein